MADSKDVLIRAAKSLEGDGLVTSGVAPSPTNDEIFEDVKKDVIGQEPSPDQDPQDTTEDDISSTQDVKPEVTDARPIDNVAWEAKRKVDELYPLVNEIKTMLQQGGHQKQEPQYTKAQLQAYAIAPDTATEQRLWAYGEIDKMEKSERMKEYQEIMRSTQDKTQEESRRAQGAQWVGQNFPDTVIKDSAGNPVGWNQNHPILLKANEYISRSKNLQSDPEGFVAAVKMAAYDLGVHNSKQLTQKVERQTAQLRKEQKKQLASSGGSKPAENSQQLAKNRLLKLQAEYAKTGSSTVFQEIVKIRGLNPWI